jgi:hypothetical protein
MNAKLERDMEGRVSGLFKLMPYYFLDGMRKTTKVVIKYSRSLTETCSHTLQNTK